MIINQREKYCSARGIQSRREARGKKTNCQITCGVGQLVIGVVVMFVVDILFIHFLCTVYAMAYPPMDTNTHQPKLYLKSINIQLYTHFTLFFHLIFIYLFLSLQTSYHITRGGEEDLGLIGSGQIWDAAKLTVFAHQRWFDSLTGYSENKGDSQSEFFFKLGDGSYSFWFDEWLGNFKLCNAVEVMIFTTSISLYAM